MNTVARKPDITGRMPSIPFAAIGARHTRQTQQPAPGCPCCGAPLNATKPFIDANTNTLIYKSQAIHLRPCEALIAGKLIHRMPGIVLHDSLIGHVWDDNEPENARKCIEVNIHALRLKLRPLGLEIVNVFTVGYRMVVL